VYIIYYYVLLDCFIMHCLGLSKYDYNMYCVCIVIVFNLYVMCINDVVFPM